MKQNISQFSEKKTSFPHDTSSASYNDKSYQATTHMKSKKTTERHDTISSEVFEQRIYLGLERNQQTYGDENVQN